MTETPQDRGEDFFKGLNGTFVKGSNFTDLMSINLYRKCIKCAPHPKLTSTTPLQLCYRIIFTDTIFNIKYNNIKIHFVHRSLIAKSPSCQVMVAKQPSCPAMVATSSSCQGLFAQSLTHLVAKWWLPSHTVAQWWLPSHTVAQRWLPSHTQRCLFSVLIWALILQTALCGYGPLCLTNHMIAHLSRLPFI